MADRTPSRGKGRAGAGGAAAVAAGAARASGERARRQRHTTPLLTEHEPAGPPSASEGSPSPLGTGKPPTGKSPAGKPPTSKPPTSKYPASKYPAARRPAPRPTAATASAPQPSAPPPSAPPPSAPQPSVAEPSDAQPPASSPAEPRKTPRRPSHPPRRPRLNSSSEPASPSTPAATPAATPAEATLPVVRAKPPAVGPAAGRIVRVRAAASRRTSGGDRLVAVGDAAESAGESLLDALAEKAGRKDRAGTVELQRRVAGVLAFLRRRLTGDFAVDEFGFDPELTDTVLLGLARPLYRRWFRVEVRGIENIPDSTAALIVANHSGAIALDALMTQVAVHDEHPKNRHLRMLGADLVFSTPVLGEVARKGGATLASNADAERLLSAGEVVGVWPEGFKGIGKPFSERYKLQRFGRGGFVSAALKTGAPIVPCAIVGAEETYPIIGDIPSVARLLGLPYAPITPTWPLLGLLGLVPLPSKWLIEFGAPLPTDEVGSAAAEDPMMVFDLTDRVRQTIQQTLYSLLVQRRSVFF
jgi:1-acyl-sn-glycerol-3-phosphate acyltransferase